MDLGTTNIKVVRYDATAQRQAVASEPMHYVREGDQVVFDWEATGHGPAIVKFEVSKKALKK